MAAQKHVNSAPGNGQPWHNGSVIENAGKDADLVAKLSEHELMQLATKIYELLRQELQLERERWI